MCKNESFFTFANFSGTKIDNYVKKVTIFAKDETKYCAEAYY